MFLEIEHTNQIRGSIKLNGSKNTTLPMICLCLLVDEITLTNIPIIKDVLNLLDILKDIGFNVTIYKHKHKVIIKKDKINYILLNNLMKNFRASYYLIGGVLARLNKCIAYIPGGCNFTNRPIDIHIDAFNQLGFNVTIVDDFLIFKKVKKHHNTILLKNKSLGATINTLLAISFIEEEVEIYNYSNEPEVKEIIKALRTLGKKITITPNKLIVENKVINGKYKFKIINDRIEAGSYCLLACAVDKSFIKIIKPPLLYMQEQLDLYKKLGVDVLIKNNNLYIKKTTTINNLKLIIKEYPSFPTDLQQLLCTVLLKANNNSLIKDTIYKKRISEIEELLKLNANIIYLDGVIKIYPSNLIGNSIICKDLRCGFSLIIAGCISLGKTYIYNYNIINRGYESYIKKLKRLNVKIFANKY